jgi:hypothetical protein
MVVHRTWLALALVCLLLLPAQQGVAAETQSIQGTITAGPKLFVRPDDATCHLLFWGYNPEPTMQVLTVNGDVVATIELVTIVGTGKQESDGNWSCTVEFTINVPKAESYRLVIDPLYDETMTSTQASQVLAIHLALDADGSLPSISERPAGKIGTTDTYRIAGTFALNGEPGTDFFNLGLGCQGTGGYSDIMGGVQVTVRNGTGDILAVDALHDAGGDELKVCEFYFTLDVPKEAFYEITVGRRGEMVYSFADLEKAKWHVDLTLGN